MSTSVVNKIYHKKIIVNVKNYYINSLCNQAMNELEDSYKNASDNESNSENASGISTNHNHKGIDTSCPVRRHGRRPVRDNSGERSTPVVSRENSPSKTLKAQSINKNGCTKTQITPIFFALVFIILAAVGYLMWPYPSPTCSNTFEALKKNFTSQSSHVFMNVEVSLNITISQVKSLVLLYDKNGAETAACLANQIAKAFTCGNFQNTSVTTFTADQLNGAEDFGKLLDRFRTTINNAVVIKNVNEVKSDKAQMFHTMCDDITPYRQPSLYIFTLPTMNTTRELKPFQEARKILENKWSNLEVNVLDPLLNRVLGFVSYIENEKYLPC